MKEAIIMDKINDLFEMKHPSDDIVGFLSGLLGGTLCVHIANLTFADIWSNAANFLILGVTAMFTGGMGVFGKHLVQKYLLHRKNKSLKNKN